MRFRRRAKIFPGVYLNFSASGISTTIGVPGASINIGKKGTYLNTGIPGTGIYNRQKLGGKEAGNQIPEEQRKPSYPIFPTGEEKVIQTENSEGTTTEGLQELKKMLVECYQERNDLREALGKVETKLTIATVLLVSSYFLVIGLFIKWFRENRKEKKKYFQDLQAQLENCFVHINLDVDSRFEEKYLEVFYGYKDLLTCENIWDVTSSASVDRVTTRSAASEAITRKPVKFGFENIDIIKSRYNALHFENANGGDLYFYPAFVAIVDSHKRFGLIDIRELEFSFQQQRFIESGKIPKDAKVIDYTWAKVNKNGTPDKRFKNNYQIPICRFGQIELSSDTGLNEEYCFSSFDKAKKFADAFKRYQQIIINL